MESLLSSLWVKKKGGSERFSNFLKVTQLVNGKAQVHGLNTGSLTPELVVLFLFLFLFVPLMPLCLELEGHSEVV